MPVELFAAIDAVDRHAAAWNSLAGGVPFRRWEWLRSWLQELGSDGRLFAPALCDDAGRLVAALPLRLRTSTVRGRVLEWLGSGRACSDYLSLLTTPAQADAHALAIADWLVAAARGDHGPDNRWDLLELEAVAADDRPIAHLIAHLAEAGCAVRSQPGPNCWRIDIPPTWEEYLLMLSKSHRKQSERMVRQAFDTGRARLRLATLADFDESWSTFVRLHQRRRQMLGEPGCFANPAFEAFTRGAAHALLAEQVTELYLLEIEGRVVATEFTFSLPDVIYMYQTGVDPDALDDNPGRLIHIAIMRQAIERGMVGFDFLRGDEPYKAHWRATARPTVTLQAAPPRVDARLRYGALLAGDVMKNWIKTGLQLTGMR